MAFDFDTRIDRTNTGSLKWDLYAGKDVLPMWVADMDFYSAPQIIEALHQRADHGVFGYTLPHEAPVEAVRNYLKKRHGYEVEPEWLVWVPGLVPAINIACRAYCAEGEAVMTTTPVYPPFLSAPGNGDRRLTTVLLAEENGRAVMDFEAMEKAITPDTRLFLLSNPHNPVGRVYSREELLQLADFCARHDLVLCSDEIHCDLILDEDKKHLPTATLGDEVAARTLTLMAPSKTYNLPGLACSFVIISDAKLRARFKRALQGIITEVNCFGYAGCAAAYNLGEPWRQELLTYLRGNRDYLERFVANELPGISMQHVEATYLAWLDPEPLGLENAHQFFIDHGVGLSNGRDFGTPGKLRLNFGCPRPMLKKALNRMKAALDKR